MYSEFVRWLQSDGARFQTTFPDRRVNNIYFESPDWSNYAENQSGVSNRCKCRIRWNGNSLQPDHARFEVKRRRNSTGDKLVQDIDDSDSLLVNGVGGLYRQLRSRLDPRNRLYLDQCHHPILYNCYQRKYLGSPSGIRLTIDTDLKFLKPEQLVNTTPKMARMRQFHAILEFKYTLEDRSLVEQTLRRFPLRVTRNSKFVSGINSVYF